MSTPKDLLAGSGQHESSRNDIDDVLKAKVSKHTNDKNPTPDKTSLRFDLHFHVDFLKSMRLLDFASKEFLLERLEQLEEGKFEELKNICGVVIEFDRDSEAVITGNAENYVCNAKSAPAAMKVAYGASKASLATESSTTSTNEAAAKPLTPNTSILNDRRRLAELNIEVVRLNPKAISNEARQWYLLWSMGVDKDTKKQAVQLWDLGGRKRLDEKHRDVVAQILSQDSNSAEFLRKCLQREEGVDAGTAKFFEISDLNDLRERLQSRRVEEEDRAEHGAADAWDGCEDLFRLKLSQEQEQLIHKVGPIFLSGRSGTAKTTVLEHRALRALETFEHKSKNQVGDEHMANQIDSNEAPLVVFVTASANLAYVIEKRFDTQKDKATKKQLELVDYEDAAENMKKLPRSFSEIPKNQYVLVLTFNKFLQMLDASIPDKEYFFDETARTAKTKHCLDRFSESKPLCRKLENEVKFEPDRKSDPSFVVDYWPKIKDLFEPARNGSKCSSALAKVATAHDVYREILIVKGHIALGGGDSVQEPSPSDAGGGGGGGRSAKTGKNKRAKRKVELSTTPVSLGSMGIGKRISQEDYSKSPPAESNTSKFTEKDREILYDAYLKYETILKENEHWDCIDVAEQIWRRHLRYKKLTQKSFEGRNVTTFLSDETQDLLMKQILLFSIVCEDQKDYALSADPAQCIAHGRAFRVASLKSMWYRYFSTRECIDGVATVGIAARRNRREQSCSSGLQVHRLSQNYRSHQGILDFANAIIEVMETVFPGSLDSAGLPKEISSRAGGAPVLVTGVPVSVFLKTLFSNNTSKDRCPPKDAQILRDSVFFSADQAVLVRSIEAKTDLLKDFRTAGFGSKQINATILLTVTECKGLEFSDIVIWNFFSRDRNESDLVSWLGLYEVLDVAAEKKGMLPAKEQVQILRQNTTKRPATTAEKKLALSSKWEQELKELYVLATRAQKRLIFFEEDANNLAVKALRDFMMDGAELGLVVSSQKVTSTDKTATSESVVAPVAKRVLRHITSESVMNACVDLTEFAQPSSAEDYRTRGMDFFGRQMYSDAQRMFEAAGDMFNAMLAEANQFSKDDLLADAAAAYLRLARNFCTTGTASEQKYLARAGTHWKRAEESAQPAGCLVDTETKAALDSLVANLHKEQKAPVYSGDSCDSVDTKKVVSVVREYTTPEKPIQCETGSCCNDDDTTEALQVCGQQQENEVAAIGVSGNETTTAASCSGNLTKEESRALALATFVQWEKQVHDLRAAEKQAATKRTCLIEFCSHMATQLKATSKKCVSASSKEKLDTIHTKATKQLRKLKEQTLTVMDLSPEDTILRFKSECGFECASKHGGGVQPGETTKSATHKAPKAKKRQSERKKQKTNSKVGHVIQPSSLVAASERLDDEKLSPRDFREDPGALVKRRYSRMSSDIGLQEVSLERNFHKVLDQWVILLNGYYVVKDLLVNESLQKYIADLTMNIRLPFSLMSCADYEYLLSTDMTSRHALMFLGDSEKLAYVSVDCGVFREKKKCMADYGWRNILLDTNFFHFPGMDHDCTHVCLLEHLFLARPDIQSVHRGMWLCYVTEWKSNLEKFGSKQYQSRVQDCLTKAINSYQDFIEPGLVYLFDVRANLLQKIFQSLVDKSGIRWEHFETAAKTIKELAELAKELNIQVRPNVKVGALSGDSWKQRVQWVEDVRDKVYTEKIFGNIAAVAANILLCEKDGTVFAKGLIENGNFSSPTLILQLLNVVVENHHDRMLLQNFAKYIGRVVDEAPRCVENFLVQDVLFQMEEFFEKSQDPACVDAIRSVVSGRCCSATLRKLDQTENAPLCNMFGRFIPKVGGLIRDRASEIGADPLEDASDVAFLRSVAPFEAMTLHDFVPDANQEKHRQLTKGETITVKWCKESRCLVGKSFKPNHVNIAGYLVEYSGRFPLDHVTRAIELPVQKDAALESDLRRLQCQELVKSFYHLLSVTVKYMPGLVLNLHRHHKVVDFSFELLQLLFADTRCLSGDALRQVAAYVASIYTCRLCVSEESYSERQVVIDHVLATYGSQLVKICFECLVNEDLARNTAQPLDDPEIIEKFALHMLVDLNSRIMEVSRDDIWSEWVTDALLALRRWRGLDVSEFFVINRHLEFDPAVTLVSSLRKIVYFEMYGVVDESEKSYDGGWDHHCDVCSTTIGYGLRYNSRANFAYDLCEQCFSGLSEEKQAKYENLGPGVDNPVADADAIQRADFHYNRSTVETLYKVSNRGSLKANSGIELEVGETQFVTTRLKFLKVSNIAPCTSLESLTRYFGKFGRIAFSHMPAQFGRLYNRISHGQACCSSCSTRFLGSFVVPIHSGVAYIAYRERRDIDTVLACEKHEPQPGQHIIVEHLDKVAECDEKETGWNEMSEQEVVNRTFQSAIIVGYQSENLQVLHVPAENFRQMNRRVTDAGRMEECLANLVKNGRAPKIWANAECLRMAQDGTVIMKSKTKDDLEGDQAREMFVRDLETKLRKQGKDDEDIKHCLKVAEKCYFRKQQAKEVWRGLFQQVLLYIFILRWKRNSNVLVQKAKRQRVQSMLDLLYRGSLVIMHLKRYVWRFRFKRLHSTEKRRMWKEFERRVEHFGESLDDDGVLHHESELGVSLDEQDGELGFLCLPPAPQRSEMFQDAERIWGLAIVRHRIGNYATTTDAQRKTILMMIDIRRYAKKLRGDAVSSEEELSELRIEQVERRLRRCWSSSNEFFIKVATYINAQERNIKPVLQEMARLTAELGLLTKQNGEQDNHSRKQALLRDIAKLTKDKEFLIRNVEDEQKFLIDKLLAEQKAEPKLRCASKASSLSTMGKRSRLARAMYHALRIIRGRRNVLGKRRRTHVVVKLAHDDRSLLHQTLVKDSVQSLNETKQGHNKKRGKFRWLSLGKYFDFRKAYNNIDMIRHAHRLAPLHLSPCKYCFTKPGFTHTDRVIRPLTWDLTRPKQHIVGGNERKKKKKKRRNRF